MPNDGSTPHDCLAIMSGSDTLIIRDGVYTGDANTMEHSHRPPDGSLEAYTTIKAENTGKTIFDGEDTCVPVDVNHISYITYAGILSEISTITA